MGFDRHRRPFAIGDPAVAIRSDATRRLHESVGLGYRGSSVDVLAAYLHPVLGALAVLAAAYGASLGFEGRHRPWRGTLATHRRVGPIVLALFLASWAGGVASTALLRGDLEIAASRHFSLGTAITLLVCGSAISSRWIDTPLVRAIHPWLGATALVLSGFQIFLGFGLLP